MKKLISTTLSCKRAVAALPELGMLLQRKAVIFTCAKMKYLDE